MTQHERKSHVLPHEGHAVSWEGLGTHFKVMGEDTAGSVAVVEHTLEPGWLGAPLHRHANEDEVSYVLSGELTVQQGDEIVTVGPGSYVVKARNIWHSFWNTGTQRVHFLEIISPAGFEHYFEELAPLIPAAAPPDMDGIFALAARYGLEFDLSSVEELLEKHGLRMA